MAVSVPPVLFHFSESPSIRLFEPHVAPTAKEQEPFVWAIDEAHAPSFWFPRHCPRACCWADDTPISDAGRNLLGLGGATRLHAVESCWFERLRNCRLYAYHLPAEPFRSHLEDAGYWTSREAVAPLLVEPVGDLLARHMAAEIELRVVPNLWPLMDAIVASGLQFSIIRKANARPRE